MTIRRTGFQTTMAHRVSGESIGSAQYAWIQRRVSSVSSARSHCAALDPMMAASLCYETASKFVGSFQSLWEATLSPKTIVTGRKTATESPPAAHIPGRPQLSKIVHPGGISGLWSRWLVGVMSDDGHESPNETCVIEGESDSLLMIHDCGNTFAREGILCEAPLPHPRDLAMKQSSYLLLHRDPAFSGMLCKS